MKALDFTYFFSAAQDVPENLLVPLYGQAHITWLVAILVSSLIIAWFYKGLKTQHKSSFKRNFAVFILVFELLRQVIYLQLGRYELGLLPLHLCGITEFLIFIYAFTQNKIVKESLYALGMVGALMALLFADWLIYPMMHFQFIHSFVAHGALFAFVLMLIVSGELKPDARKLPSVFMGLVIFMVPLYFFNKAFNTNFFFLNVPSPGSPLVLFEQWVGNPGYIGLTLSLLLGVWLLMYLPFFNRRKRRYKEAGPIPVRRSS